MRRIALSTLVAAAIAATLSSTVANATGTALTAKSPAQIIQISGKAMETAGSFHYVLTTRFPGLTASLSTDSASSFGSQSQTFPGGRDTIRLLGSKLFLYSNATAYKEDFGVKNPKYANEWVEIPQSNKKYVSISIDILTASVVQQIVRATKLKNLGEFNVRGHQAVAIQGAISASPAEFAGTQTLYVSTTAPFLPLLDVQSSTVDGEKGTNTMVFSRWGEKFEVNEPSKYGIATKSSDV